MCPSQCASFLAEHSFSPQVDSGQDEDVFELCCELLRASLSSLVPHQSCGGIHKDVVQEDTSSTSRHNDLKGRTAGGGHLEAGSADSGLAYSDSEEDRVWVQERALRGPHCSRGRKGSGDSNCQTVSVDAGLGCLGLLLDLVRGLKHGALEADEDDGCAEGPIADAFRKMLSQLPAVLRVALSYALPQGEMDQCPVHTDVEEEIPQELRCDIAALLLGLMRESLSVKANFPNMTCMNGLSHFDVTALLLGLKCPKLCMKASECDHTLHKGFLQHRYYSATAGPDALEAMHGSFIILSQHAL